MANIVIMPKQGLQMTEGLITKWLKAVGDDVKEGEPLFEMETDKLTITIDSTFTGTLLKIVREENETVPITEPIAVIGEKGEDISGLNLGSSVQAESAPAAEPEKTEAAPIDPSLNIVIMPKQGLQMTEGLITKWLKAVGDDVKEGEPLFEMETDKLTITIDSSFTGTLLKIVREEGETVPITEPIAIIGEKGKDVSNVTFGNSAAPTAAPVAVPAAEPAPSAVPAETKKPVPAPVPVKAAPAKKVGGRVFITPRAKMRCAERGIDDWSVIPGSGPEGLIIERDVLNYVIPVPAAASDCSRISVHVSMSDSEKYIESAKNGGVDISVLSLVEKSAKAAAKSFENIGEVAVKVLEGTEVEAYHPALKANETIVLSAGGIFGTENRQSVITVSFREEETDALIAAQFVTKVKLLLENPLLMLGI